MPVKFLKAGKGDSILIQDGGYNVLIDGGDDSSYLEKELYEIYSKGEKINLLIITHHDDDHIIGILNVLNLIKNGSFGEKKDFIKQVFFNSPRLIKGTIGSGIESSFLSYKKSYEIEKLLEDLPIKWDNLVTDETNKLNLGNISLTLLSPLRIHLNDYAEKTPKEYLSALTNGDWNSSLAKLNMNLDDESQDISLPNRTSIVILLELSGKRILLTGDCTPDRLKTIINKLYNENENSPVSFDYMKLPHHGSYRNLNKEILNKIKCENFIITTNGRNSYLPDKRALLKVYNHICNGKKEGVRFYFNYSEVIEMLNINSIEFNKFKNCLKNCNEASGYVI